MREKIYLQDIRQSVLESLFTDESYKKDFISDQEYLNLLNSCTRKSQSKDIKIGDTIELKKLIQIDNHIAICETHIDINVYIDLNKEKYYFEDSLNVKISDLEKNPDAYNDLFEDKKVLISKFKNGNVFVDLSSYAYENTYEEFYDIIRKMKYGVIKLKDAPSFDCKIISSNAGGYFGKIKGITVFLPGSLATKNKIRNYDEIVGQTIKVLLNDYIPRYNTIVVSYKDYVEQIYEERISKLREEMNIVHTWIITGKKEYGLFVEFDNMFTSLFHINFMTPNVLKKFKSGGYNEGDKIDLLISKIDENGKIFVVDNGFENRDIKTIFESFKEQFEGNKFTGKITKETDYGFFVGFLFEGINLNGLILKKNINDQHQLELNQECEFVIDKVIPEEKRIYLNLENK